jgi:hypothetical protein
LVPPFVVDDECLVGDHRPQQHVDRGKGHECVDVRRRRDEGEQDGGEGEALVVDRVGVAESQDDVGQQVGGGAAE